MNILIDNGSIFQNIIEDWEPKYDNQVAIKQYNRLYGLDGQDDNKLSVLAEDTNKMPFNEITIVEIDQNMKDQIYESTGNILLNLCDNIEPTAGL